MRAFVALLVDGWRFHFMRSTHELLYITIILIHILLCLRAPSHSESISFHLIYMRVLCHSILVEAAQSAFMRSMPVNGIEINEIIRSRARIASAQARLSIVCFDWLSFIYTNSTVPTECVCVLLHESTTVIQRALMRICPEIEPKLAEFLPRVSTRSVRM